MPSNKWKNEKLEKGVTGEKQEIKFENCQVTYESKNSIPDTFGLDTDEKRKETEWLLKQALKETNRLSDIVMYIANLGRWDLILFLATQQVDNILEESQRRKAMKAMMRGGGVLPPEIMEMLAGEVLGHKEHNLEDCEECPSKDECEDYKRMKDEQGDKDEIQ